MFMFNNCIRLPPNECDEDNFLIALWTLEGAIELRIKVQISIDSLKSVLVLLNI